jgi:hypothetical protein
MGGVSQTSINAHPASAPEGKTAKPGRDHHHSLYSPEGPPSFQTVREYKASLLGIEDNNHLRDWRFCGFFGRNSEEDVHYRNDSMLYVEDMLASRHLKEEERNSAEEGESSDDV